MRGTIFYWDECACKSHPASTLRFEKFYYRSQERIHFRFHPIWSGIWIWESQRSDITLLGSHEFSRNECLASRRDPTKVPRLKDCARRFAALFFAGRWHCKRGWNQQIYYRSKSVKGSRKIIRKGIRLLAKRQWKENFPNSHETTISSIVSLSHGKVFCFTLSLLLGLLAEFSS